MAQTIAGITIPDSALAREAAQLVRDAEPDLLYNHSLRVFVWGALQGQSRGIGYDPELLYVGALFHDLGLNEGHRSADLRFEVDGANAARDFLRSHGVPEESVRVVWDAVALHTTPGIPEHKEPEVALVNAGVAYDVVGVGYDDIAAQTREAVIAALPRENFKEGIIQAFYDGFSFKPDTTFGTMNADVLADKDPAFQRVDFCALIRASKLS
jgi:hypothetical protein